MDNQVNVNCLEIENYVMNINVQANENSDVTVQNGTLLNLIGKGVHGAVFQVNDNVCIKVYGEEDVCARELYALSLGQNTSVFPKVFCSGPKYIAMEMIYGIDLREYLQSQPLTKNLAEKLIHLLITFKKIGLERIDHHKRHIFVQDDGSLKVLDVGTTVWRNRVYPYPRKLLNSLGNEYKEMFLEYVREMAPELFEDWQNYIEMEKYASLLHEKYFSQEDINPKKLKKEAKILLTGKKEWNSKIRDLVRKVHKEQWIRTLIARGMDLEYVKTNIEELEREYIYTKKKKSKKESSLQNKIGQQKMKVYASKMKTVSY
ncbi:hypothetical protein DZB84_04565 [Bacillus sp. HNG]|uniref:hypothetical protein n=1 Tax=Bacillus sp. HNG TaxID=2293325 RepID=UPI000E2E4C8A|nr:hypothetical protein [Bacillus sp. HNG]RFB18194.1 hypothetical protein DZB84_04565 [Bacillus sp. HNG]